MNSPKKVLYGVNIPQLAISVLPFVRMRESVVYIQVSRGALQNIFSIENRK